MNASHCVRCLALAGLMLLGAAHPSLAIQAIQTPQADTNSVFINQPTVVTVTAQVSVDAKLIPGSVTLVRYDSHGKPLGVVGRMVDDGTAGDVLRGDGTFTAQITLNEASPGNIILAATAGYKNSLLRSHSSFLTIPAIQVPTDAQILTFLSDMDAGTNYLGTTFPPDLQQQGGAIALADFVAYLEGLPGVSSAGVTPGTNTVWVTFDSGLQGLFNTDQGGEKGGLSTRNLQKTVQPWHGIPSSARSKVMEPAVVAAPQTTGNGEAIALAPFFDNFAPSDETDNIATLLGQTCGGMPTPLKNASADVNAFKALRKYGVISISAHGDVDKNGQVVILTRERATFTSTLAHLSDWVLGRIINDAGYWAIEPSFIKAYAGTGFPQSLVYVSACLSTNNDTMANAFLTSGAKTYFGYSQIVQASFSYGVGTQLFTVLTDPTLGPDQRTSQKAFDSIANKTDPGPNHAIFQMRGATDLALLNDPVINGGFEAGDFTGWVSDPDIGYDKVVTEDKSAGTYSARIGRWDQLYTFFGGLNGPPVDGAEPAGTDYIYQDVMLAKDVATLTLSFDYNLDTFDGASYDYFTMEVQDADTGAVLAVPVSGIGGIINGSPDNWGLYYTTGWTHVSYDLTPFAGRHVRLIFKDTQDGYGDQCATYIDHVSVACTH